jgi:hypothetical protein
MQGGMAEEERWPDMAKRPCLIPGTKVVPVLLTFSENLADGR